MIRGISGDEESVRDFIVAQITPHAERVTIDAMGNISVLIQSCQVAA